MQGGQKKKKKKGKKPLLFIDYSVRPTAPQQRHCYPVLQIMAIIHNGGIPIYVHLSSLCLLLYLKLSWSSCGSVVNEPD